VHEGFRGGENLKLYAATGGGEIEGENATVVSEDVEEGGT